jgi:hypothetical protein
MTLFERRVPDGDGELIITVRTDSRLKKSVRWTVQDQTVLVRAPQRIPRRELERMVDSIVAQLRKKRQRARSQGDAELQNRAEAINRTCFGGELAWNSIRGVNNMEKRLGRCTSGGPTDGDIRISSPSALAGKKNRGGLRDRPRLAHRRSQNTAAPLG